MKIKSSILSLTLFLSAVNFAHASGISLACSPSNSEAFDRTLVTISAGSNGQFTANISHGSEQTYNVEQLGLDDLTLQVFQGEGFTLIYNSNDNTASVVAPLGGKSVALVNLTCTPSESGHHPSITATN